MSPHKSMSQVVSKCIDAVKKYKYLIAVLIISMVVYHDWLSFCIYTYADYRFQFSDTLKDIPDFSVWRVNGFGVINSYLWRLIGPNNLIFGIFGYFGFDSNIADKFLIMWPWVILSVVSSYLFVKSITKSDSGSVIGSFVFCYNTYFLSINTQGHLLISIASSLSVLSFLFYMKMLDKKEAYLVILTALLLYITGIYDMRFLYISFWLLLYYALYYFAIIYKFENIRQLLKKALVALSPIVIVILLNLFWILVSAKVDYFSSNKLLGRGLFGSSFFNISEAIALFHPFWTGDGTEWFIVQSMASNYWAVPIFAFAGLFLNRRNKKIVFFGFVSILGVFLSKQRGEPFGGSYPWLFNNLPGFNAFREASKFYFLIALGYSVLIGSFVSWMWRGFTLKRWQYCSRCLLILTISVIFLWNAKPIITGEIGTMFVSRHIPQDYEILNNYISEQKGFFRMLWVPSSSKWGIFTNKKPIVNYVDTSASNWDDYSNPDDNNTKNQESVTNIFKNNFSSELLNISAIRYIIVPIHDYENGTDFFESYETNGNLDIRSRYVSELNNYDYLKRLDIGAKDLVVYENEYYRPYIYSLNKVDGLDSFKNLNIKYSFLTNEVGHTFAVYDSSKGQLASSNLYIPFESLSPLDIKNGIIDEVFVGNNDDLYLYENVEKQNVIIEHSEDDLIILRKLKNGIYINGLPTNIDNIPETLFVSHKYNNNYLIEIGTRLVDINDDKRDIDLGTITEPFNILSLLGVNLIKNASFESGKWNKSVGDCNAYDENSIISMGISSDSSRGDASIQLDATNHIACINQNNLPVSGGEAYLFGFDYKGQNAKNAGYYIQFNDSANSVISEKLPINNENWNTFQKKITVPKDATKMSLYIYSYSSNDVTTVTTKYDNFKLFELVHVATVDPRREAKFQKIVIPNKNKYEIEYLDNSFSYDNLINNPSFEGGLWSGQVGDCNKYDTNGRLSMNKSSEQKTDGDFSLQLGATRHIACTGPGLIPVTENLTYLFSFDYQSPNGKQAKYYLGFNDPEKTVISERLSITDSSWHSFNKQIKIPSGANTVSLVVYAFSDDGTKEIINRYDNFSLIELPDLENRYFFVTEPEEKLNNPASVDFELINPTNKKVHVKGATTPFYLAMSESFHPQWQAQMNNQKIQGFFNQWVPWVQPDRIEDGKHFELDGFLNGWYVDTEKLCANNSACTKNPDGSYDMEMVIEFFPQRWFYLGLLISGTTFVGCVGYLGYDWRKRRKKKGRDSRKINAGFPPEFTLDPIGGGNDKGGYGRKG